MQVRDKILLLLDSWQEAFGGPGGKYRQYHWAYLEVKVATDPCLFPKEAKIYFPVLGSRMISCCQHTWSCDCATPFFFSWKLILSK